MIDTLEGGPDGTRATNWPSKRELAAIAGFWLLYGALSVTNGLFPPGGQQLHVTFGAVLMWGVQSLVWMVLTPPIFWLTSRVNVDRVMRIASYVLAGLCAALLAALIGENARSYSSIPMRGPNPQAPRPLWSS